MMLGEGFRDRLESDSIDNSPGSSFSGVYHVSKVFKQMGVSIEEGVEKGIVGGGVMLQEEGGAQKGAPEREVASGVRVGKKELAIDGNNNNMPNHYNNNNNNINIYKNINNNINIHNNININNDTQQKPPFQQQLSPIQIHVCNWDSSNFYMSKPEEQETKLPPSSQHPPFPQLLPSSLQHPPSPQLLSPYTDVKKKHSQSAGDLKSSEQPDHNPLDNHGNLYMNVDEYETFFSVAGGARPVKLHKKASGVAEYNKDTIEALKKVTRKFDSFRMRMLRANSFYDHASESSASGKNGGKKDEEEEEEEAILGVLRNHHSNQQCNDFNRVSYAAAQLLKRNSKLQASQEVVAGEEVSAEEVDRIRFFYSSIDCTIFPSDCLVDVLVSVRNNRAEDASEALRWVQVWTGVPVLLFNGGNHPRRPRQLTVAVAERETGMPLWKQTITYSSEYREVDGGFSHLLEESGRENRTFKMRWSRKESGQRFLQEFRKITSDHNDPLWRVKLDEKNKRKQNITSPSSSSSSSSSKPPPAPFKASDLRGTKESSDKQVVNTKFRKLSAHVGGNNHFEKVKKRYSYRKEDISVPCDLRRVTRVDTTNSRFRSTFAGLLPVQTTVPSFSSSSSKDQKSDFRPRLPTN